MKTITLTPCKFTFDDTPEFDGFSHGSKWNGFDNVAVTKEQLEKISAYFWANGDPETASEFADLEQMENGLFSLGWGYATQIVRD
jgi:hypothetical protein